MLLLAAVMLNGCKADSKAERPAADSVTALDSVAQTGDNKAEDKKAEDKKAEESAVKESATKKNTAEETAAAASNSAAGMGYLSAALATGLSCLGGGIAVSAAASAALGAISEDSSILGKSLIFVGLAEGVCLYGLIISFMILGKL